MEIADVRKRVRETIDRVRRQPADRRARTDAAAQAFERFLVHTATPLVQQIAGVLRAEGYSVTVFTPAGSVRLMSDRRAEDFIELSLTTASDRPRVVLHSSHARASGIEEAERSLGDPSSIREDELLAALLTELEPLV